MKTVSRIDYEATCPANHATAYVVADEEPVLVDAGAPEQTTRTRRALDRLSLDLADVEHLLITHPHPQHIGQLTTMLSEGEPRVYAPDSVRERLRMDADDFATEARQNLITGGFSGERLEQAVGDAVTSLTRAQQLLPVDRVAVWVAPGETVAVGSLTVHAVHTPGHQADHLCFHTEFDDERLLFSGDMALQSFRPALVHDSLGDGYQHAVPSFFDAVDRLDEVSVDRVYPGHGPVHAQLSDVLDRDRRSLNGRIAQIEQHVDGDGVTAATVVDAIHGDDDFQRTVPEVMSVLAFLEEAGRLDTAVRDGVVHYYAL